VNLKGSLGAKKGQDQWILSKSKDRWEETRGFVVGNAFQRSKKIESKSDEQLWNYRKFEKSSSINRPRYIKKRKAT